MRRQKISDMCYTCDMPDLNLRGVPGDLICRLKSDAALSGIGLRDHCVLLLSGNSLNALDQYSHKRRRNVQKNVGNSADDAGAVLMDEGDQQPRPIKSTECTACGALNGNHFKGCKAK